MRSSPVIAQAQEYGIATEDLAKAQADGRAKVSAAADSAISDFDFEFRLRKMARAGR